MDWQCGTSCLVAAHSIHVKAQTPCLLDVVCTDAMSIRCDMHGHHVVQDCSYTLQLCAAVQTDTWCCGTASSTPWWPARSVTRLMPVLAAAAALGSSPRCESFGEGGGGCFAVAPVLLLGFELLSGGCEPQVRLLAASISHSTGSCGVTAHGFWPTRAASRDISYDFQVIASQHALCGMHSKPPCYWIGCELHGSQVKKKLGSYSSGAC
jgi:hypothetical protein